MVRKLVVIAAALGLGLGTATTTSAQSIIVGGEAGINIADVSVSTDFFDVSPDSRTGFWGGIYAEFGIGPIFAIRPEVLYSAKGFKISEAGAEARLRANYIQIPVLFEAVIPVSGSPIRPVLFVGPAFAFETSCKVQGDIETLSLDVSIDCDDPIFDGDLSRKTTDFSLIFGGELGVAVGRVIPAIGVRYDLGLTNLDDSDIANESIKNRTLTIYGQLGVPVK